MNDDNNEMVEAGANAPVIEAHQARLNVTWDGKNGDLVDPIDVDATDAQILTWATEAVRGGIPGIDPDPLADLNRDFVVDRFPPGNGIEFNRVSVRPKTPFGH